MVKSETESVSRPTNAALLLGRDGVVNAPAVSRTFHQRHDRAHGQSEVIQLCIPIVEDKSFGLIETTSRSSSLSGTSSTSLIGTSQGNTGFRGV